MSYVNKNTAVGTNATTASTTYTGATNHNLLVAAFSWSVNGGTTGPSLNSTAVTNGWKVGPIVPGTTAAANSAYATGISFFYLQDCPTGSSTCGVTFPNSAYCQSHAAEWSGYATTGTLDISVAGTPVTNGTSATVSATPGQANELIIIGVAAKFASSSSNIALTDPPTGFTSLGVLQDSNTSVAHEWAYKEITSVAAQSATWTVNSAGEMVTAMVSFGTVASPAPVLTSPVAPTVGSTTSTIGATTDTGNGTLYGIATTGSISGITAAQIVAGTNASNAASPNASVAVSSSGAKTVNLTGQSVSSAYNYAIVHRNTNGDSNIVTGSYTTLAAAPVISSISGTLKVGSTLTINGTFPSTQSTGTVVLLGTVLSVLSWSSTVITATVALGTNLYGVTGNLVVNGATNGASNAWSVTGGVQPATGTQYINLATPDTVTGVRVPLTASPTALASGMQIEVSAVQGSGTVTLTTAAEYTADPGVSRFTYRVGVSGSGYGTAADITLIPSISVGASGNVSIVFG